MVEAEIIQWAVNKPEILTVALQDVLTPARNHQGWGGKNPIGHLKYSGGSL